MTVCVAAICENGRKFVAATDRRLSFAGIASDALAGKMFWYGGDWLFLYAGAPSHIELVNEELRAFPPLERTTIHKTVRAAYRQAKAEYCAHAVLAQYDLSMKEFKSEGLKMFGAKTFNRLSDQIDTVASEFYEQLLVIGYGKTENSAKIFEIGPNLASHALSGVAAIGSGAEVALSNLLLLNQARHRQLADTIYAVAAAKFSSEMSQDSDVGNSTLMYVGWKRTETDEEGKPPGTFLDQDEIAKLRDTWEKYGKPRIPIQSPATLWPIVSKVRKAKGEVKLEDADLRLAAERLAPVEEWEKEEDRARRDSAKDSEG